MIDMEFSGAGPAPSYWQRRAKDAEAALAACQAELAAMRERAEALEAAIRVHRSAMAASLHPMMDGSERLRIKDLLAKPALAAAPPAPAADEESPYSFHATCGVCGVKIGGDGDVCNRCAGG